MLLTGTGKSSLSVIPLFIWTNTTSGVVQFLSRQVPQLTLLMGVLSGTNRVPLVIRLYIISARKYITMQYSN